MDNKPTSAPKPNTRRKAFFGALVAAGAAFSPIAAKAETSTPDQALARVQTALDNGSIDAWLADAKTKVGTNMYSTVGNVQCAVDERGGSVTVYKDGNTPKEAEAKGNLLQSSVDQVTISASRMGGQSTIGVEKSGYVQNAPIDLGKAGAEAKQKINITFKGLKP